MIKLNNEQKKDMKRMVYQRITWIMKRKNNSDFGKGYDIGQLDALLTLLSVDYQVISFETEMKIRKYINKKLKGE